MKLLTTSTLFVNKITHGKLLTVIHCQLKKSRPAVMDFYQNLSEALFLINKVQKKLIWNLKKKKKKSTLTAPSAEIRQ